MPRIAIYDPAGCCSTGVCDPATSDAMAQFASAIDGLTKQGVEVERYELSSNPGAYVENAVVKNALDTDGVDCPPLVIVDGEIVSKGSYLSRDELSAKTGVEIPEGEAPSCCGPAEDTKEEADASSCCG